MRIAHVASSISRLGGGVSKVVRDLAVAQTSTMDSVKIYTLMDEYTAVDQPLHSGVNVVPCPVRFLRRFGYSPVLHQTLQENAGSLDMLHLHGLWMYPSFAAGSVVRKMSLPYLLSPHGMLDSRSLTMSRRKKELVKFVFEGKNIERANCLHACSEMEADHIRDFGYGGPIAIIPTGLTPEEIRASLVQSTVSDRQLPFLVPLAGKKILLFLSRLHEQKGLDLLLAAWQMVREKFPDWQLVIAGDGEPGYLSELQRRISAASISDSVTLVGPVYNDAKWSLFRNSSLFVLPSYSENFGLVVVEALASCLPVITTKGAPWEDLQKVACGWWIDADKAILRDCLLSAMSLSENEREAMGERGRTLVESKYAIGLTAQKLNQVYCWLKNGGSPPPYVIFD